MKRLIWGLTALLLTTVAHATIVRSMSVEQMANEADVVVHGRVTAQSSAWNETKSRIYTVTDVEVIEPIKGERAPKSVVQVRQIGGTVDGISQTIVGNAKLTVGEEVVLFLDADEKLPFHYVIGMAQGKYAVDRASGEPQVVRSLSGLALADVKGDVAQLKPHAEPTAVGVKLEDFKASVRAAIKAR